MATGATQRAEQEDSYEREMLLWLRALAREKLGCAEDHQHIGITCIPEKLIPSNLLEDLQFDETASPVKFKNDGVQQGKMLLALLQGEQPSTPRACMLGEVLPPPPSQSPSLPSPSKLSREITQIGGPPPPPMQPPSVHLSLQASLPPPWEVPELPRQPATPSASVQVSLCASLPPPSPPLLSSWQVPLLPTVPPVPCLPPTLPPMLQSTWPASFPPTCPPSLPPALQSPLQEAVPSWDASCDDSQKIMLPKATIEDQNMSGTKVDPTKLAPGFVSPSTCAGSENESTIGFSMDEASLCSSGSEKDLMADLKKDDMKACLVSPPPGLDGCLCPWFKTSQDYEKGTRCGYCSSHKKHGDASVSPTHSPSEENKPRAISLASLI